MLTQAEPKEIASGSTVIWTKSLPEYPSPSFTLGYKVVGAGGVAVAAVEPSGAEFTVTLTATALASGIYRLIGWVTNQSGARITVYESSIEVTPNLIDADSGTETRSYWQQLLDAIKDVSLNRASIIQRSMTLPGAGSRSIEYLSADELYTWQKRCEYELQEIEERERIKQGKSRRKILIRFQ